jgi:hypothetical protein
MSVCKRHNCDSAQVACKKCEGIHLNPKRDWATLKCCVSGEVTFNVPEQVAQPPKMQHVDDAVEMAESISANGAQILEKGTGMDFGCVETDMVNPLACQIECNEQCSNAKAVCASHTNCIGMETNPTGTWATLKCCSGATSKQVQQYSLGPLDRQRQWCGTCQEGKYECNAGINGANVFANSDEDEANAAFQASKKDNSNTVTTNPEELLPVVASEDEPNIAVALRQCLQDLVSLKTGYQRSTYSSGQMPKAGYSKSEAKKCRGRGLLWAQAKIFMTVTAASDSSVFIVGCNDHTILDVADGSLRNMTLRNMTANEMLIAQKLSQVSITMQLC